MKSYFIVEGVERLEDVEMIEGVDRVE